MIHTRRLITQISNVIVFSLLLTMSLSPIAHAQNHGAEGTDAYDFPVKPGTEAWKALETHAEMLEISQIPESALLQGMSTEGLVETVLSYPLYGDMLAYNSLQQGFNAVVSGFNGLPELLNRQDTGTELLARYRAMNPAAIEESWTLEQQGKYGTSFTYIEMLLAQDAILDSLTETQRRDLLAEALAKSQSKQQYAEIYGQFGQERTALLIGRALQQTNADAFNQKVMENAALKDFLDDGTFASVEVLNEIFSQAQQFLFGKVSAYSGDNTIQDYPGTVYTPNGSPVSVQVRTEELTSAQINAMNNWVETHYPNATRETNASRKYNCHSYAWHSTSTSNNKWMNSPGDDTYWNDGSYVYVYDPFFTIINTRVSYANDNHSAITVPSSQFRSKWGSYPRMKHLPSYCPYISSVLHSYKRNN